MAKNSDAVLVKKETHILCKNKKVHKIHSYQIQVNNRDGDEYGEIQISHSPLNKVSNISGYVTDRNGKTVKKLKKSDRVVKSDFASYSFYEDDLITEFNLRHNTYPYTIHYSYEELEEQFVYVSYWYPVIGWDIPTLEATLIFDVPNDLNFIHKVQGNVAFSQEILNNNETRYRWSTKFETPLKVENYAPPLYSLIPSVKIVPEEFNFEIPGSFKTWKTYGNWQYVLNKSLRDLPEPEIKKISQLTEGISDTLEIVKVLYHYLQDYTRYIYIGIETGGLKPYPASYVAQNKYGDCKALSNYFQALLAYKNIKSFYCKVRAGEKIDRIDTTFPSQQSNHIIVCVPLQADTVWLDCTSDFAFGYLGTFTQNRSTLKVEKENSRLIKTPDLKPNDVLESRNIDIVSGEDGTVNVNFLNTYRGSVYEDLFTRKQQLSQNEMDRYIRNRFNRNGLELNSYSILKSHRDSAKISISISAINHKILKQYGNETLVKVLPLEIPFFEKTDTRTLPIQIDYPIFKIDTIHYNIPEDLSITSLPENTMMNSSYGEYEFKVVQNGQHIQLVKSFLLNAGDYSIENYEAFYSFINDVKSVEKRTYIRTEKNKR